MADLSTLLLASLKPETRKQAEQNLSSLSTQPGFLTHLLRLVLEQSQDRAVRLSGSIYLKNITKLRWEEVRVCSWYRVSSLESHHEDRYRMYNLWPTRTRPLYGKNLFLRC